MRLLVKIGIIIITAIELCSCRGIMKMRPIKSYDDYINMRYYASLNTPNYRYIQAVLEKGVDVNHVKWEGQDLNPLITAIRRNSVEVAKYLINAGADLSALDKWRNSALIWAIDKCDSDFVCFLIEKGVDVNKKNLRGDIPLDVAARRYASLRVFQSLFDHGAILSKKTLAYLFNDKNTDLVNWGRFQLVKLVVDKSIEQNVRQKVSPALYAVITHNTSETEKYISEKKQEINSSNLINTIACFAVALGYSDIIDILVKQGFDFDRKPYGYRLNFMQLAANSNQIESVKKLIALGVDVDKHTEREQTPLILAITNNNKEIVQILLENGASDFVNYEFNSNLTEDVIYFGSALMVACAYADFEIVNLLMQYGLSFGNLPNEKHIPNYILQRDDWYEMLTFLQKQGFDINKKIQTTFFYTTRPSFTFENFKWVAQNTKPTPDNCYTISERLISEQVEGYEKLVFWINTHGVGDSKLLLQAVWDLNYPAVKLLVERGADLSFKYEKNDGDALCQAAERDESTNIVNYLLSCGMNINAQNNTGDTPLIRAVKYYQLEIVDILLKRGANTDIRNNDGKTAKDIAVEQKFVLILELFGD